ncbi:MAG: hypothetical protein OXH96_05850 [Spirochaetaceae bacterium]|nr:hypothetical protein [Spirochaetaceae bacterium]
MSTNVTYINPTHQRQPPGRSSRSSVFGEELALVPQPTQLDLWPTGRIDAVAALRRDEPRIQAVPRGTNRRATS